MSAIDRNSILWLARYARADGNTPLCDLLLVVAGMLAPDGRVVHPPEPWDQWEEIGGPAGAWGKGFMIEARSREGAATP